MNPTTFLGGLLLGLASSPHCAGMCGAVGSTLTMALAPDASPRSRLRVLLEAEAGKAGAYVVAGAVLGGVGAGMYGLFDRQGAYMILQHLATAGLVWVGLSLMGLVPGFAGFERAMAPLRRWAWKRRRQGDATAVLAGLVWGLMPCGMVYSALLFAMISGSAFGGAAVMAGFGLGVIPSVTAAAFGASLLPALARGRAANIAVGAALVVMGVATLFWPMGGVVAICRSMGIPLS